MKSIPKFEQKFLNYVCTNIWIFIILISLGLSILARVLISDFLSGDAIDSLIPWYETIKNAGGFSSLQNQVGNYNILYQTIIAMLTYLPFDGLFLIKCFSGIFDVLLGVLCSYIVYAYFESSKTTAALFFGLIINCPTVMLNSALWGQCDSIYTFWGLLAVCMLIKDRYPISFLFLGIAFSFKLQAVFFVPFFIFYYIYKKSFSIFYFLEVPIIMIASSIVGIVNGRNPIKDVFGIYLGQTQVYRKTWMSYASFWGTLIGNNTEEHFTYFKRYGLMLTCIVLMIVCVKMIHYHIEDSKDYFLILFALLFTSVFFLPSMHERYDYSYVILSLLLVAYHRKFFFLAVGIVYVSLTSWSIFLFEHLPISEDFIVFINYVCYFSGMYYIFKALDNKEIS